MPNSSLGVPGGQHASICLGSGPQKVVTLQTAWGSTGPVDMPQSAQGPNSWEADLTQPAQGFDLQEAVMLQSAWVSAL